MRAAKYFLPLDFCLRIEESPGILNWAIPNLRPPLEASLTVGCSKDECKASLLLFLLISHSTGSFLDSASPLLAVAACTALGEIGRNAPLPIPNEGPGFTKLHLVESLLARIPSGKETNKVRFCCSAVVVPYALSVCLSVCLDEDFYYY